MTKINESKYYDVDFWYTQIDKHGGNVHDYGKQYYAYQLFEKLVAKLTDMPDEGYIVVLGTHNCVSFDLLCSTFGKDRCIGFDIANPTNHPQVRVDNILNVIEDLPIAFVHNDVGNFSFTPIAKLHAQIWAAKNVVPGGYFLGRNNYNKAKLPLEHVMERHGFTNANLSTLTGIVDLKDIATDVIEGHMLSKKTGMKEYY